MYLHSKSPKHYQGYIVKGKYPVILIPGLTERWAFLKSLGDKISMAGHPVYVIPKLKHNLLSIPKSAKIVEEIIDENKLRNVILVTHSKGGLIGKYLLMHLIDKGKIKGMIAIATPFAGSSLAKLISHHSFKELAEGSEIIDNLKSHQEVNSKIISLYPEFDNQIMKENSSFLAGAENIKIDVKGHHKIIFDKDTQMKILGLVSRLSQK